MVTIPVELRTDKTEDGYILTELTIIGAQQDTDIQLVISASILLGAARKIVPNGRISIRRKL